MIVFRNPGLLDLRCLRSFGVSVKPETDSPIGRFGSGLKAAICILMRLNHEVTLFLGLDRYTFGTQPETIRGKTFQFVTMTHPDGTVEQLPYNTHVGEHWENWTPYRELHSNVLDEGGETFAVEPKPVILGVLGYFAEGATQLSYTPREGETAIVVRGPEIEQAHRERASIFLTTTPLFKTDEIAVHQGSSRYAYYRGIRARELDQPSLFTYNLLADTDLTEDRTIKFECDIYMPLGRAIAKTDNEYYLRQVLIAPRGTYEYHMSGWGPESNEPFLRVYQQLRAEGEMARLTAFADSVYKAKHKTLPLPDPIVLNRVQQTQLDRAIAFCKKLGWSVTDYPIVVVPHAHGGLLALAEDGKIILTQGCFDQGTKVVAHAILEEFLHLKHDFKDMTREFQTHLFRQLLSMGEQLTGDAL